MHKRNGITVNWYNGRPGTVKAALSLLIASSGICQKASFKSIAEIWYVPTRLQCDLLKSVSLPCVRLNKGGSSFPSAPRWLGNSSYWYFPRSLPGLTFGQVRQKPAVVLLERWDNASAWSVHFTEFLLIHVLLNRSSISTCPYRMERWPLAVSKWFPA